MFCVFFTPNLYESGSRSFSLISSLLTCVRSAVRMTRGVLLRVAFYLLCSGYCRHYSSCVWHNTRQGATFAQGVLLNIESGDGGKEMESNRISSSRQPPRILTLLTTYNKRTVFAKANREAMEQRADGYESLVRDFLRCMRIFGKLRLCGCRCVPVWDFSSRAIEQRIFIILYK